MCNHKYILESKEEFTDHGDDRGGIERTRFIFFCEKCCDVKIEEIEI